MVAAAGGLAHSIVLRQDGTVWAWGANSYGQLGDGTRTSQDQLVQVKGMTSVVAIAAGANGSAALKNDGTVWVWGDVFADFGASGQFSVVQPAQVPGLSGIKRIAAHDTWVCAQSAEGRVWEWDARILRAPGSDGTQAMPREQPLLAGALAVVPGPGYGLALRADGAPVAWGYNHSGRLGAGTAWTRLWPEAVSAISNVVSVAAWASRVTIVTSDGTLWEWATQPAPDLKIASGISDVVVAALGSSVSYALRRDGTVWSWGQDLGGYGSLGDGATMSRPSPLPIAGLANIKAITSGGGGGVALTTSGTVWTWGINDTGQLGDGSTMHRSIPAQVAGLTGVKSISAGQFHVLAVCDDGSVWAWGSNSFGQIGDGTRTKRLTPTKVSGLPFVTSVANATDASFALASNGTVWSWGGSILVQGIGPSLVPTQLAGLTGVRAIWADAEARFAQTGDGSILSWGGNKYGKLGDGTTVSSRSGFVRTANLPSSTISVVGSSSTSLAVTDAGQLWAWSSVPFAQAPGADPKTWTPQLVLNTGSYTLGTSEISATFSAGSRSVSLTTTTPDRPWVAARDSFWLSAAPTNGSTNATLTLNWQPNPYPESRTGTIRVGGQTVTVTQTGTGASYKISGQVTLNGVGVPGIPVMLTGPQNITKLTDSSGRYDFATLSAGANFTVTPVASNLRLSPASQSVAALAADQTVNFTAIPNATSFKVNRSSLQFASTRNGTVYTPPQELTVTLSGTDLLLWTATSNRPWLAVTPGSGSGSGKMFASLVPAALPASGADTAMITITAPNLPNGTVTVSCSLTIHASTVPPFGSFDTPGAPLPGAPALSGQIPVTGWALDDIGVQSVKIWRDRVGPEPTHPNGYIYIGDALFVPDARPDVEARFPTRPSSHVAGWGYMMLTNALPVLTGPRGNGAYRIHAIATDTEGNQITLGSKDITVNNRNATKPFGTIDSPGAGETVEGSTYANGGWALTPQPAIVPIDGSTLSVWVDGAMLGRPTFNQARGDIASIFPGYANSAGAGATYALDTTKLSNGMHAIAWAAYDNQGRGEGLGSRYFYVLNSGATALAAPAPGAIPLLRTAHSSRPERQDPGYAAYRTGYSADTPLAPLPDEAIQVAEVDRIELHLPAPLDGASWSGGLRVGDELRTIPVGSTLDSEAGIFYWQLGAGFLGEFTLEFRTTPEAEPLLVRVRVAAAGPTAE